MPENQTKDPPGLPVYYMKLTTDNVDARLGKLREGQVVALDQAKAARWLAAGVAVQTSDKEFNDQQDRKAKKATAAQEAFQNLNSGSAVWDVATYRDVLTAPEGGLRLAFERGIPLVNVHVLRDEDGDPLPPDADIEDILDARQLLHPDLVAPLAAHERSSVMGGGSPYTNVVGGTEAPMPLSPAHRAMMAKVADQERYAQQSTASGYSFDRNDPKAKRAEATRNEERANRAARRAAAPKPEPKLAPNANQAAADAGVAAPETDLSEEQRGN